MPSNARVFECDTYRIFAQSAISGQNHTDSGTTAGSTAVYGHSGTLSTAYTPDSVQQYGGFSFSFGGTSTGNAWSVTYTGPGAPLGVTYTGTGYTTVNCEVLLTDVIVYHQGGTFRLVCNYEVIVQGVSRLTGAIDEVSGGLGPAYIPLIGIPAYLSGGASAGTTVASGTTDTDDIYAYMSECTGTVTGGWSIDQGSGAVGLPMLVTGSAPAMVGGCTDPGVATVTAGATDDVTIVSYARSEAANTLYAQGTITACITETYCNGVLYSTDSDANSADWWVFELDTQSKSRSGSIRCVPDLDRAIIRINSDFAALFYRSEMPQTTEAKYATCNDDGVVTTSSSSPEVHPHQAEILMEVGSTLSTMEDTLDTYRANAPWSTGGSWSRTKVRTYIGEGVMCPSAAICPGEDDTSYIISILVGDWVPIPNNSYSSSRSYSFPNTVGASADMIGYLGHSIALPRYINSWCNPLWSYLLWNEPWELETTPTPWADYWEKLGQQYLYNSSLADPSLRRNHLVSEALVQDLNQPFLDTFVAGQRWIGQSRWKTLEITPRTTYTYDSTSTGLWTAKDANDDDVTLTHGTDVDVPGTSVVKLRLGSWAIEPYMWAHFANQFILSWTGDVTVFLEDQFGKRVPLATTPGTYDIAADLSKKYAGTWAQDYGCLVTTDVGTDVITSAGRSTTICGDAESLFAPMMSSGYSYKYLVFVVTDPASIVYPTLNYTLGSTRLHVKENALQDNIIHPEGPIVRFGTWNTGAGGTIDIPPAPASVDLRPDLIDWLTQYRYCLQGITETDTALGSVPVTTQLTQLFDTYEGQSVGGTRNGAYGYWLPSVDWRIAVINSMAEIPPLGVLPHMARDADWMETGDYAQFTYIWAQDSHYALSTSETTELRTDDSVTVWFDTGTEVVTGWFKYTWDNSLVNDEIDYEVWDAKKLALLRPWRGFCYFPGLGVTYRLLSIARADDYEICVGFNDETQTDYTQFWGISPSNLMDNYSVTGLETTSSHYLHLFYHGTFVGAYLTITRRDTVIATISTTDGTCPSIAVFEDGEIWAYWLEGEAVYHARYSAAGDALQTRVATNVTSGVDSGGLAVTTTETTSGRPMVVLATIESGILNIRSATDGITFS